MLDKNHRWHKLPDDVKDSILDKHRDWNVDGRTWWDYVYNDFIEDMANIGIRVDQIFFSGFWSQGDGACFEGRVVDWELFFKSLGYTDPVLVRHFKVSSSWKVAHFGHYYHENCTSFSGEFPLPTDYYVTEEDFLAAHGCGEELRDAALIAALSQYNGDTLEAQFEEAFKDHMRDLYRRLESEYDHLTSDEAVLESLEANDMLDELIDEHLAEAV